MLTVEKRDVVFEKISGGASVSKVAREMGLPAKSVKRCIKIGEAKKAVAELMAANKPVACKKIAEDYGVSDVTVGRFKKEILASHKIGAGRMGDLNSLVENIKTKKTKKTSGQRTGNSDTIQPEEVGVREHIVIELLKFLNS